MTKRHPDVNLSIDSAMRNDCTISELHCLKREREKGEISSSIGYGSLSDEGNCIDSNDYLLREKKDKKFSFLQVFTRIAFVIHNRECLNHFEVKHFKR